MQRPPWKVVRCFSSRDGTALVHLQNISGGVLAGDHLIAGIDVREGCRVVITTSGSTRIYKTPESKAPAQQELTVRVGDRALVEYVPDSLIPFAGSRYRQRSTFRLAADSGLFAWEIVAPGRSGEQFAYHDLGIETEIWNGAIPIAFESWRIEPQMRGVTESIRLGIFPYQASFYICRTGLPHDEWLRHENSMAELARTVSSPHQIWGISKMHQGGLALRGLADEAHYLQQSLIRFWRLMKLALYGSEPIPPRKMY